MLHEYGLLFGDMASFHPNRVRTSAKDCAEVAIRGCLLDATTIARSQVQHHCPNHCREPTCRSRRYIMRLMIAELERVVVPVAFEIAVHLVVILANVRHI